MYGGIMKIQSVSIDGFRSIRDMHFETAGNLQIIIGKNDTGKSNIIRAMDLFFNGTIDKAEMNWNEDFNHTYFKAKGKNAPNCMTISIQFFLQKTSSAGKLYQNLLKELGEKFIITKKIFQNRTELFFSKTEKNILETIITEKSKLSPVISSFLSYIHYFYVPINKDEEWLKNSFIFNDIKNRFIDAWGKGGVSRKNISNLKKDINDMLGKIKKTVDDGMSEITTDFCKLFPEFEKVTFQTPKDANDLFRLLEIEVLSENKITTTLGFRGAGVQSASIPLLLYYVDTGKAVSARASLYFPVWAIEEPESFQHDDLESKIAQFFYEKVQKKIPVFITTHSNNYLKSENMQNIHLCIKEKGFTKTAVKAKEWSAFFSSISKEIGFANITSDLLSILMNDVNSKVLVVEGKYDKMLFEKIKSLDERISTKFKKYSVLDGEGGNLLEKVKVLHSAQKQTVVIVDADKDGDKYKNSITNMKSSYVKVFSYSKNGNAGSLVLESFVPSYVRTQFEKTIPKEAKEYWFKDEKKIEREIFAGVCEPPRGWDKNSIKNKLCCFYINKYSRKEDFEDIISFYLKIAI